MKRLGNIINKFVQSDWFIAFEAFIILLGWGLDIWMPMLCVLIAVNVLPLFFFKDTKHLLSLLILFMTIIRTNRHRLSDFAPLLALVGVLFVGMIVNLIRFKRSINPLKPSKIHGFHLSLFLLIIPFALGGIGSQTENVYAIITALAFIVLSALGYTFFFVTNAQEDNKSQLIEYVVKVLFAMGIIALIQSTVVLAELTSNVQGFYAKLSCIIANRGRYDVGWAGPNNISITIAMCIPATLYMCIKYSYLSPIYVMLAFVEMMFVLLSGSRGSVIMAFTIGIPTLCYVAFKTKNRSLYAGTVSVILMVLVGLLASYPRYFELLFSRFLANGLSSSGRFDGLFVEAIEQFKQHKLFGVGWDYRLGELTSDNYSPYWFHSTALQILANMGIVGIICFIPFYFFRYATFARKLKCAPAVILLLSTLIFEGYGMMDTLFFSPTFFIVMLVMTFVVEVNLPTRYTKKEKLLMANQSANQPLVKEYNQPLFPALYKQNRTIIKSR